MTGTPSEHPAPPVARSSPGADAPSPGAAPVANARPVAFGDRDFFVPRRPVSRWASVLLGLLFVTMGLGVWAFVTHGEAEERVISPVLLPSPQEIMTTFPELWTRRELPKNAAVSLVRVLKGFAIAVLVVIPLGTLMGAFPGVRAFFEPLHVIAGYLPLITIVPLTFAWFLPVGDEFQKVMFLALACFFFMLPLIVKAVSEVDEVYVNTAWTLGAKPWQLVTRVLFPVALPEIYYTLRMAIGVGWTWIIVAEMMVADRGLGYIFNQAYRYEKPHMYWVALVILAIGFATDRLLDRLGRLLFPYRG